jgi:arsenate reductase-like glutaredoxin family protein
MESTFTTTKERMARQMITEWLKKERKSWWQVINANSTTRQKLKSIDTTWKQIEKILDVDLNLLKKK